MTSRTLTYIEHRGFHARGLIGGLLLGTCGIAVALSAPAVELPLMWRTTCTALGWASFMLGLAMRFWATLYVGGRKVGGRRESVLVVDGPYSVVRNPLYFGSLLMGLSTVFLLQSGVLLGAVVVAALHYALSTIPAEEEFLRRNCGEDAFNEYTARTPRFLPRFSLYQAPTDGSFYTKALRNEARRAIRLLAVPIVLTLLAAARYEPWWPTWLRLP